MTHDRQKEIRAMIYMMFVSSTIFRNSETMYNIETTWPHFEHKWLYEHFQIHFKCGNICSKYYVLNLLWFADGNLRNIQANNAHHSLESNES